MTRKFLTALLVTASMLLSVLALGAFTPAAGAQTSTDIECTYDAYIRDDLPEGCRKQIVYVDSFPEGTNTYTGSVDTPDGLRAAECVHLSAWRTACVLGELLPVIPNPQLPTPTPTPDAVPAPQLAFTGADTNTLAYVGSGLIGLGAMLIGLRRRHEDLG